MPTDSSEHLFAAAHTPMLPDAFDATVFDRAERSVKYMVFTNTWVRYCNDTRRSSGSSGSSRTFGQEQKMSQWTSTTTEVDTIRSRSNDTNC